MNASDNPILAFLRSASLVKERELNAVVSSFLFVVVLMSAYYILRPVRDAMASDWSDAEVSWLWTLNFFISTGVVALYGAAVSRFRFKLLVPATYGIFAASFVSFYVLGSFSADRTLIDKSFYNSCLKYKLLQINLSFIYTSDLVMQT